MKTLAGLALVGLTACGADSGFGPSQPVVSSAPEEPMKIAALALPVALVAGPVRAQAPEEPCVMHIEQEGNLLHAFYDSGVCYPPDEPLESWKPAWVQVDMQQTLLTMEVMDYPAGRRADDNRGWYMKPTGPAGTYEIQARSGYNGGRAETTLTYSRKGLAVAK